MCDIIMSDMPHIEYRKEKKFTEEQQKMLSDVTNANNDKIRQKGLSAMLGIDLSKAKTDKEVKDMVKQKFN